jgi:hypothetical protein
MMGSRRRLRRWLIAGAAAVVAAAGSVALQPGEARAIIGRPLTPLSFAGVARRTTRRAVVAGGVAAPYAYGPYYRPYGVW